MRVAVIGTSSLSMGEAEDLRLQVVATRYGEVPLHVAAVGADEMLLLRRAGARHPLEPSRVNYRANILALRDLGAELVLSTCVAGSLRRDLPPGALVDVSQFIDFTRHRPPTLFDEHGFGYTDMTLPYCPHLRSLVRAAASAAGLPLHDDVCYVGVDGPRYETAAEVRMFRTLGGDVVGHTGVTEAIMAREAGLCYACVVLVSNYGAGISDQPISNEDVAMMRGRHAGDIEQLVRATVPLMLDQPYGKCGCANSPGVHQLPNWRSAVDQGPGES
ncbi:MAG: MTAP family purine nucleoside phosphorylase [Mycobacteriales bacterium]